jgi:hypothetical protein
VSRSLRRTPSTVMKPFHPSLLSSGQPASATFCTPGIARRLSATRSQIAGDCAERATDRSALLASRRPRQPHARELVVLDRDLFLLRLWRRVTDSAAAAQLSASPTVISALDL